MFNVIFIFLNGLFFILLFPFVLSKKSVKIVYFLWSRFFLFVLKLFGVKYKVINSNKIPQRGTIIAGNHQSAFEILILAKIIPNSIFVLKQELMNLPIISIGLKNCGMIQTSRQGTPEELRRVLVEMENALKCGKNVIIFPQGTRVSPDAIVPYRLGFYALYEKGFNCVKFATNTGNFWSKDDKIKRGTATIKFDNIPLGLIKKDFKNEFALLDIEIASLTL